ncbi:universal stress protein [Streptomyces sp. NPDC060030]|uniref:universal stress protein n=1 Tax=Streptomyces sp. NPDC060030 TaxID=3347042 RepID=UPI0036A83012
MEDQQHDYREQAASDGPKVILVGIDGSPSSMRAAAYAAGLARRQKARLVLAYVQHVASASVALGVPVALVTEEIAQMLSDEIRSATEHLKNFGGVQWEFHTFPGDPYRGLVKAAGELQADALVVGASESAGHRFIGSVALRLVRLGRWPVTVVP